MRRGFKSQCEKRSLEIRKRMDLNPTSSLSAFDLAAHEDVKVISALEVGGLSESDSSQLCNEEDDSWSALTIRIQSKHLVIYKPISNKPRINSVVMHELSHIMLGHELESAGMSEDGHLIPSNFNQEQEDEADWLAGTLLLPRPALLSIKKSEMSDQDAMQLYSVSRQMLTWRVRMTGVNYQLSYARGRN